MVEHIYDFLPSGAISGHALTFIDAPLLPGLAVFLKLTQFANVYLQSFSLTILPWGVWGAAYIPAGNTLAFSLKAKSFIPS